MKCGITFNMLELTLTIALTVLITLHKSVDLAHFKAAYGPVFKHDGSKKDVEK